MYIGKALRRLSRSKYTVCCKINTGAEYKGHQKVITSCSSMTLCQSV